MGRRTRRCNRPWARRFFLLAVLVSPCYFETKCCPRRLSFIYLLLVKGVNKKNCASRIFSFPIARSLAYLDRFTFLHRPVISTVRA